MAALGVCAAHLGKCFVQVSTSQVFLDHFVHNRPEEPVLLLLTMLVIAGLEIRIVVVKYLPQGGICWLSWVIDWRDGSHKSPFAEAAGKLVLRAWAD